MLRPTVFLLAALLACASPVAAAEDKPPSPSDEAAELARQAAEKMIQALRLLIDKIPQYEMPEINENGDIIIRRKHKTDEPPAEKPPEKPAPPKDTRT